MSNKGLLGSLVKCTSQEIQVSPYIQKITKDTLRITGQYDLPEAHWSRGAVTTAMLGFIQWFCENNRPSIDGCEAYELIAPMLIHYTMLPLRLCLKKSLMVCFIWFFISEGCSLQVSQRVHADSVVGRCLVEL